MTAIVSTARLAGESGGERGGGAANGVDSGAGEGSSSRAAGRQRVASRTLDDVMREPSTRLPDVVVVDSVPEELERREVLNPKEDLWLSTSDGYV